MKGRCSGNHSKEYRPTAKLLSSCVGNRDWASPAPHPVDPIAGFPWAVNVEHGQECVSGQYSPLPGNLDSVMESGGAINSIHGQHHLGQFQSSWSEEAPVTLTRDLSRGFGTSPGREPSCKCISCLSLGDGKRKAWLWSYPCRVPKCSQTFTTNSSKTGETSTRVKHEKSHFLHAGKYKCAEKYCHTVTSKFADLKRHYTSVHCFNRTKYACSVIGCKHSGQNGFARKDNLKSHFMNVHAKISSATTVPIRSSGQAHGTGASEKGSFSSESL